MNPVAIQLGPFSIRWYAICIVLGLLLAVILSMKEAPRKGIESDDIIDFILIAFPVAIIGARLYYVIFQWSYYREHPGEIFAVWNGGIAIYGGLLAGALVLYLFSRSRLIDPVDFLDIAAPSVMIAQSIGRWGNFVNQEAYGAIVKNLDYLPSFIRNQMFIDGHYRQPTFLYESIWCLIGFIVILIVRRLKITKVGQPFALYLMWYGLGRFVIESMRTDSLMLGGFKIAQIVSVIMILVGLVIIMITGRKGRYEDLYDQDENEVVRF